MANITATDRDSEANQAKSGLKLALCFFWWEPITASNIPRTYR